MLKRKRRSFRAVREVLHVLLVLGGAFAFTLAFFLVLPILQTLTQGPGADLALQTVDTAQLEAPPPPPEEEPEEEKQEEEPPPPELAEESPPLDLSQLEMALNPGFGGEGALEGDFAVRLNTLAGKDQEKEVDELFSIADLDQKPRAIYQAPPQITKEMRQKAPGSVYIIFIVDERGRVENPIVQQSTDPVFDKAALNAVKQWKFEPGKRNGRPVRFRMRVPITFPKG